MDVAATFIGHGRTGASAMRQMDPMVLLQGKNGFENRFFGPFF
jgi:hypothetical protein